MKRFLSLFIAAVTCLMATTVWAETVSKDEAAALASSFLSAKTQSNSARKAPSTTDLTAVKAVKFLELKDESVTVDQYYIIQEDDEDGGWVLMAADDAIQPILGYSDTGTFDTSAEMPDNLKYWLGMYNRQIKRAIELGVTASDEVAAEWTSLRSGVRKAKAATVVVGPLLTTTWNQGSPYNNLCPTYSGSSRSATGCVATAMSQVMNYWEWPNTGQGSKTYTSQITHSINFANTTFDWANMKDSYGGSYTTAQATAVATLMYNVGVSVEMSYGSSSGAMTIPWPSSSTSYACAKNALWNYFKYDADSLKAYYRDGSSYYGYSSWTDANWIAMLKAELNKQRPIMYAGSGDGGGHSFVCDGYRDDNYFHFNWGWGGSYDGYFTVNSLTPGGGGIGSNNDNTFNDQQDVIIGIVPSVSDKYTVTYSAEHGTCGTASWTQTTVGQSCVLPDVTPDENYHFLGWTDLQGSKTPNCGQAGDTYTPMRNLTLYAVLIQEASLVYFVTDIQPGFQDHTVSWTSSPSWTGHGTCTLDSIYEDGEGTGVVLPDVISDAGWTMQEWLIVSGGSLYIAGWTGDTFYPSQDTAYLYAYWTPDGKVYLDEELTGVVHTSGPFEDLTQTYGWIPQADGYTATFVADENYDALTAANTTVSVKVGDETLSNVASFSNGVLTITLTPEQMIDDIEISVTATVTEGWNCDSYSFAYNTPTSNQSLVGTGTKTLSSKSWTITAAVSGGTATASYKSTASRFYGSSGNTTYKCTSVTYTSSAFSACLINSITINAWTGSAGTIEAFINGISLGSTSTTTDSKSYTFSNPDLLKGDVKFVVTNGSGTTKYVYVKSINITMADKPDGSMNPGDPITVTRNYLSAGYYDYNDGEGDPLYVWQFVLYNFTFTNGQITAYKEYYAHLGIAIANSPTSIVGTYNMPVWALYDLQAGGVSEYYDDNEITITYKQKGTGNYSSYYIYHVSGYWYDESGQKYIIDSDVYTELSNYDTDEDITPTGDTDPRYYKVQHWQQNVDGGTTHNATNYTLKDTETGQGGSGETFATYANYYTGFLSPDDQNVTLTDGNTSTNPAVVNYYYDRRKYPVVFVVDNIEVQRDSLRYGATAEYTGATPTRESTEVYDYEFTGWSPLFAPIKQATTYTAQFNAIAHYTVSFNLLGHGEAIESQTILSGGKVTRPADPSETGYSFGGWYTDESCLVAWDFNSAVTSSMTLYAKWTVSKHTLAWDANGGLLSGDYTAAGQVAYGTALVAPTATRTGYTFASWNPAVPATMPDEDQTFVAQWTANTNTAYVVNHYKQNVDNNNYTLAETDNLTGTTEAQVTPDTKDYGAGFTAPAQQTVTILADGSLVVTYNYTRNAFALTWDADGGSISGTYTSGNVKFEAPITAPANANVTKTGYDFQGWDKTVPATMPAEALTIKALWNIKTYALTFTSNDESKGTVTVSPEQDSYNYGATVTITATAEEGYSFSGWSDGSTDASRTLTVGVDVTTSLTATFVANDNTAYEIHYWKQNILDNEYTEQLPADYKTGTTGELTQAYKYLKVYEGFDRQPYEEAVIKGDGSTKINVYYNRQTFQIRFLVEGVEKQNETLRYGATPVFNGATPTKAADAQYTYSFDGWDPAIVDVVGAQDYNAKFAQTLNQYTVSFNLNGHGAAIVSQSVGYGLKATEPSAPSETGYTFGGWYKEAACENAWDFAEDVVTGAVELFAKWTINSHTLTWDANGGEITSAESEYTHGTVAFGTAIVRPTVKYTGFSFTGWLPTVAATMPDDNVTYVAQWTEAGDTPYKVQHWQQNINDDDFTLFETDELTGVTGGSITPLVNTYEGFNSPAAQTVTILASGDLVVRYEYTRKSFNLVWNANGGQLSGEYTQGSVKFGKTIAAPADPTWTGHTFHGWNPAVPATMPANDLTLVAQWTTDTYQGITFKSEDETKGTVTVSPEQDSYEYGQTVTVTAEPNEGYEFTGWSDGSDEANRTITVDENTESLTASFAAKTNIKYTVRHFIENLAGEFVQDGEDEEFFDGETDKDKSVAPRTYTGFTTPSAQTKKIAGDGSTVFEYQYIRSEYALTWNANGGTLLDNGRTEGNVKFEAPITAAVAERKGYTFLGWGAEVPATMPAKALTFTAQWQADVVEGVSFSSEDEAKGTVTADPQKDEYNYDDVVTITAEANDGYTFTGWSDGNEDATRVVTVDENTGAIVAQFKANDDTPYFVRHWLQNLNDDNYTEKEDERESKTGTTGATVTPEVKAFEGFAQPEAQELVIAGDGKAAVDYLYARNSYELSWDANGGALVDNGRTEGNVKFEAPITAAIAERKGYDFKGWDAEVPETMPARSLSFKAVWEAKTVEGLTFTSNDEEKGTVKVEPEQTEYNVDDEITVIAVANEGYEFQGWSNGETSDTLEIKIDEETESIIAVFVPRTDTKYIVRHLLENLDGDDYDVLAEEELQGTTGAEVTPNVRSVEGFTAPDVETANILADGSLVIEYKYARNSYELVWSVPEDAEIVGEFTQGTVKFGAEIVAPETVTRAHFFFLGWDEEVPETMPAKDVTLTALWQVDTEGIEIVVDGGTIFSNKEIRIYDFNGRDVTGLNGNLGNGLYIVVGGGQTAKIAIFR